MSGGAHSIPPGDIFATTRWTLVLAAGQRSTPESEVALEELCRTYWYPLYAYVRRRGHAKEDAEDLTQAFFARLLEKNSLQGLSSERGKFRAFLLAALKHFLANEWDRASRQKRGGGAVHLSLDWESGDERYQCDVVDTLSPDLQYDRAWAVTLLDRVVARLREEHMAEQKTELFDALKPFLTMEKGAIPYIEVASTMQMSEGAARVSVHRLRLRYREILREEIAQTLADPSTVADEMQALFASFAG
ncbi:RNA polymerase sigma-70 factor (ECF subfamily) [Roseimicrobium gellanilyticum]|uniref:RNA polymerase sigma-70 factor (ECF subfamily) n=1 Tax=Roseimicrobium gellanilyticum TaxID=748857 RepID=A0A366HL37_9BACT|nr:sigma factor [Roseimicrobium gellanilyticum]RBP43648.1 RNA polymerase sigma-70 factor (ECF subfamily) [Roseimicrobium gellanilyticum]